MSGISVGHIADIYAEGLRYFMGEGTPTRLSHVSQDLEEHGINHAVIGAVALLAHGYPRFTEDIDLVMTAEGLEKFHRVEARFGTVSARIG